MICPPFKVNKIFTSFKKESKLLNNYYFTNNFIQSTVKLQIHNEINFVSIDSNVRVWITRVCVIFHLRSVKLYGNENICKSKHLQRDFVFISRFIVNGLHEVWNCYLDNRIANCSAMLRGMNAQIRELAYIIRSSDIYEFRLPGLRNQILCSSFVKERRFYIYWMSVFLIHF